MTVPFVDLNRQYQPLKEEIQRAMAAICEKANFILGGDVSLFEKEFAEFCRIRYGVGVASGTDALFLSLRAMDIGPEDEVILPVNTFIATAFAVSFTGAHPVFIDVNPETYTLDIQKTEDYIKKSAKGRKKSRIKAIIPVHLYGYPADMKPLLALGQKYHLKVIEDACQAHGAGYKMGTTMDDPQWKPVGSLGDAGCFSFYPAKNLGAFGDGGIIVTNDETTAKNLILLRNYGQEEKNIHLTLAHNSRLDTLQAAVLRIKLRHLNEWNESRRNAALLYQKHLAGTNYVLPQEHDYGKHVYHLYVIRTKNRKNLMSYMKSKGIQTQIHYPCPLHLTPAYKHLNHREGNFPVAEVLAQEILSLPMFPGITEEEVTAVAETLIAHERT